MHFIGVQPLGARALRHVGDGPAQTEHVLLVGILDHGHDQPVVERDRDAKVDVFLVDDILAVNRRVDDRMSMQYFDDHAGDECHVGQLRAGLLVFRFLLLAQLFDRREVDVKHRVHVRRRVAAENHVLGDLLPHHRELLDPIGARGPHLRVRNGGVRLQPDLAALDVAEDVLLGDAAADTGAGDLRDVDVVILRDAANER